MALVSTKKMFEMAYKNGYAIGAFNVNNDGRGPING
jgi:fructose-bisphosphate aldolase class II